MFFFDFYTLESLCELCFYPCSVVKNKPPRKASAEHLGPFMPTSCFSLIFISFIYIYISRLKQLNKMCFMILQIIYIIFLVSFDLFLDLKLYIYINLLVSFNLFFWSSSSFF